MSFFWRTFAIASTASATVFGIRTGLRTSATLFLPAPTFFTIISDGKRARSWRQTSLKILLAECLAKVPRQAAALAKEVEPMLESRREMVRKVYSPCSNLERGTCDKWKFLMPKANR